MGAAAPAPLSTSTPLAAAAMAADQSDMPNNGLPGTLLNRVSRKPVVFYLITLKEYLRELDRMFI